jgi:hypothetical protein
MDAKAACAFLEGALATFQDVANGFANVGALKSPGNVGDGRQLTRRVRACLGDDDLIRVGN